MARGQIEALGVAIRERREALGLSTNRLAQMFPVDPRTITRWEKGETATALQNIDAIAKHLQTSPDRLLARSLEISQESNEPDSDESDDDLFEYLREIRAAQLELLSRVATIERLLKDRHEQQPPGAQKDAVAVNQ